jgi:hypothetical protein
MDPEWGIQLVMDAFKTLLLLDGSSIFDAWRTWRVGGSFIRTGDARE